MLLQSQINAIICLITGPLCRVLLKQVLVTSNGLDSMSQIVNETSPTFMDLHDFDQC